MNYEEHSDSYVSFEPTACFPVFIPGTTPRNERPVYLDNCGETDEFGHSYCEYCWQEECEKRSAKRRGASQSSRIYGIEADE